MDEGEPTLRVLPARVLGQYRVRWRGCDLRIGGPGGVGLLHTYQKGCRSLSRQTGCELDRRKSRRWWHSWASGVAPNDTPGSDKAAPVNDL